MFLEKNRERIEKGYKLRMQEIAAEVREEAEAGMEQLSKEESLAMKFLYMTMPVSDMGNYPFSVFEDFVRHGVFLYDTSEFCRRMPEEIFLNYVLHHRVNEEEIEPCRSFFYSRLNGSMEGLSMKECALLANYWCAREVTYHCADDRTLSAMAVFRNGQGRCGEESTFAVNVLRSMGIPARQVYAPRWSHCDDNHAWAEVWCDGEWYFLGACEPEEILNKGWFTNASSRSMLIHSRWFDSVPPEGEDIITTAGGVTLVNQLSRYAKTEKAEVHVVGTDGRPLEHVRVDFSVLNYAEFFPVATMLTDKNGKAVLTTGLGSILAEASYKNLRAEMLLELGTGTEYVLMLQEPEEKDAWEDFDFFAPKDTPVHTNQPGGEEKRRGAKKLAEAKAGYEAKMKQMNHKMQEAFLKGNEPQLREKLFYTLTEKDRTDVRPEVLEEHFQLALPYKKGLPEEIFIQYVANPRIKDEILLPWREMLDGWFTEKEKTVFRKNPSLLWEEIEKRIQEREDGEYGALYPTPAAAVRLQLAGPLSQKFLFVAAARTLGIPARLSPVEEEVSYYQEGTFVPLEKFRVHRIRIRLAAGKEGTSWAYLQNFTIARLTDGRYQTLNLSGIPWKEGRLTFMAVPGLYRILTVNRLPNGNMFAKKFVFRAQGEEREITLSMRDADLSDMLENISIFPFALRDGQGRSVEAAELTGEGKSILLFLEEGKEPTEHILNELMEQKEEFRKLGEKILFVVRTKEAFKQPTLGKCKELLPRARVYYDSFEELIERLGRRMYVDPEKLPLVIVTKGSLNGIYAASGYNVGTGDMLLRVMKEA